MKLNTFKDLTILKTFNLTLYQLFLISLLRINFSLWDHKLFYRSLNVSSKAGEIHILEVETGKIIKKLSMYGRKITAMTISPNSKSFAAGDNNYKILLWNLDNFEVI